MDEARLILAEYKKAQDSAEHHDRLSWSVTTTAWLANFVLLGFATGRMGQAVEVMNAICMLGVLVTLCAWFGSMVLNTVKRQKYAKCKELEGKLNGLTEKMEGCEHRFSQHGDVQYPQGRLTFIRTVVSWLLILGWLIILSAA